MLLDPCPPAWHFHEYHETLVAAGPEAVYQAMRELDAGRSPLVGPLLRLR